MILNLPFAFPIVFILTTLVTLWLFIWTTRSIPVAIGVIAWLLLTGVLAVNGVYSNDLQATPPKLFILGLVPAMLVIVLIVFAKGRAFKNGAARKWLLAWNIICFCLLINIVTRALLSAPLPFQKLAFDQPNIAILHFPFVWLPAFIVPVVLFGHLVSIR